MQDFLEPKHYFFVETESYVAISYMLVYNRFLSPFWVQLLKSPCYFVPETVSPLHVRSKVFMAPFHVRSIGPFYVWTKDCKFARHLEGSNADFAPHMQRRHSFRDKQIAKIAKSANLFFFFLSNHLYLSNSYDLCDNF